MANKHMKVWKMVFGFRETNAALKEEIIEGIVKR
jgi:hypothetical protein